jgi:hypothetical protein
MYNSTGKGFNKGNIKELAAEKIKKLIAGASLKESQEGVGKKRGFGGRGSNNRGFQEREKGAFSTSILGNIFVKRRKKDVARSVHLRIQLPERS